MFKFSRFSFTLLVSLLLIFGSAFAQSRVTGGIRGIVSDQEEAPLPGVSLTLTSPSLMATLSTVSDSEGKYRFMSLPSGTYAIETSLPGFASSKITEIKIHAGMTATIDIVLSDATVSAEVTVVGKAPLIDVTDSTVGKAYFTKEFLENVPTARDTFRLINAAPGVTYLSSYGSGDHTGNLYQIDGVELVDAWFGGGIYSAALDYDIIEETQFVALGAPAEYGNFTGSAINIITKSGGNTLSGDVHFYLKGKNWQSSHIDPSDPEWALLTETPLTETYDVGFHLGGPIIKDKLWFFSGFNYLRSTIEMASLNMSRPLTFPKGFLKLTFQPNERNRFNAFLNYHKSSEKNMTFSPLVPEEANYAFVYPVWVGNFSWLHTFSPSTILELKFAGNSMLNDYIPNSGRDLAGHYDLITGESTVNSTWWGHWKSERYALSTAFSHYVEKFIKGPHDFKVGFEVEKASGGGNSDATGGVSYYDLDGQPYIASAWGYKSWGVNWRYTVYAQDDWRVLDRLVINPGLRFSLIRGSIPDLNQTVYKPNNLEPRIGFVWDIDKNHKTVVKAHYGRYYEGSKSYYFSNLQPSQDTITYSVGPNWSTLTEIYRNPGGTNYSIDPDIKHPSMDQVVAGVERIVGRDLTLGVSFIYRYWKNFIEAVNTTATFELVPIKDPDTGQTFTVYNQLNPGEDRYYITNPKVGADYGQAYPDIVQLDPYRKYRGVEFVLNKRFSNNWQFQASYVYSKEDGTYGNSHAGDTQRSWMGHQSWNMCFATVYFDPTNQINLKGNSIISSPHVFKAYATYLFPLDISLSAFYQYSSGRRWERNLLISTVNQSAPYLMTEPRGSRSLPAQNSLDMRLEKAFSYSRIRFSLAVDMFNVFNQVRMTQVMDVVGSNFGQGLAVNTPRTIRASVKLNF